MNYFTPVVIFLVLAVVAHPMGLLQARCRRRGQRAQFPGLLLMGLSAAAPSVFTISVAGRRAHYLGLAKRGMMGSSLSQ